MVTGRIRVTVSPSGVSGRVDEFLMEEHGQSIKGVMNRYRLAQSPAAQAMRKTYNEVFLGGNVVALELPN